MPAKFFAKKYLAGKFNFFNCKREQGLEYFAKFAAWINIDADMLNEEVGKFSLDVAKLIIGGVVLASIVKEDLDPLLLIGIGMVIVLFFCCWDFISLQRRKRKRKMREGGIVNQE